LSDKQNGMMETAIRKPFKQGFGGICFWG